MNYKKGTVAIVVGQRYGGYYTVNTVRHIENKDEYGDVYYRPTRFGHIEPETFKETSTIWSHSLEEAKALAAEASKLTGLPVYESLGDIPVPTVKRASHERRSYGRLIESVWTGSRRCVDHFEHAKVVWEFRPDATIKRVYYRQDYQKDIKRG